MSDSKVPTQTYKASCHCGAFAYTVKTASLDHESTKVTRCNCSICMRRGLLSIYVPNDDVAFTSGQLEDLKVHYPPRPPLLLLPSAFPPTTYSHPTPSNKPKTLYSHPLGLHLRNPLRSALLLPHLRQLVPSAQHPAGLLRRRVRRQCAAV